MSGPIYSCMCVSVLRCPQSLASRFFLTAPIAAGLRAIESVVDVRRMLSWLFGCLADDFHVHKTFAFTLIGLIPTQGTEARTQFVSRITNTCVSLEKRL